METFDWAFEAYRDGAAFTAFDIETTGLEPKQDRIVELGAVKFDRRGPICRYSALINPGAPMPEAAGRVNGITDEMLAGQPFLEAVFPDFLRLVNGTVIIAHNAPFDTGFVNESLRRFYGAGQKQDAGAAQGSLLPGMDDGAAEPVWAPPFPALPNRIADTLVLARRLFPQRNGHKLQELAAALNLDVKNAHRAEDDARICMEIFVRMVELVKSSAGVI
ncbi:MAG: 3'-5' exonuclease [Treponema sp.]|nr:3'-5' exonuclease [Treponema sp.]